MNRSERSRPDPAAFHKILLIRLRRIGDIVMTTPAVSAIKRALPRASLSYVVEEPFRRLVEHNPHIDRVMAIPAKQGASDFARFIRGLRREAYDAVIDFHGGPRASRITWLARGGFKVGYRLKYKGWIYDVRVPRTAGGRPIHSVENHLNLVRALGIEVEEPAPPLLLPEASVAEKARIDRLWAENGLGGAKVVVVHVGAGNEFRDWGEKNLTELAQEIAFMPGVRVILAGAQGDRARAARIAGRNSMKPHATDGAPVGEAGILGGGSRSAAIRGTSRTTAASATTGEDPRRAPILSLAGEVNLIELREMMARAALFVGPDSGPMHIAATTRTPIVALFGPTLPDHFAPWQAVATIVAKDLACRPCKQRECITRDFRCLRTITVGEVLAAVRGHL